MPAEQCLADMDAAKPLLVGLHVFQWDVLTGDRQPLSDGESAWLRYLAAAAPALPDGSFALLEFVKDDDPHQFLLDAQTLRQWLTAIQDKSR
jgi:hypothetical protein